MTSIIEGVFRGFIKGFSVVVGANVEGENVLYGCIVFPGDFVGK
jgi:hypothetical protein